MAKYNGARISQTSPTHEKFIMCVPRYQSFSLSLILKYMAGCVAYSPCFDNHDLHFLHGHAVGSNKPRR
jgi:hypothetical protein